VVLEDVVLIILVCIPVELLDICPNELKEKKDDNTKIDVTK